MNGKTVNYTYYPSGYYTRNHYDSNGYLTKVTDKENRNIWEMLEENARGQLKQGKKGNNTVWYDYDSHGFPDRIYDDYGIIDLEYDFNNKGNLAYREDYITGQYEDLGYDTQNRLIQWNNASIVYNQTTGNITTKSDIGNYTMGYGEENGKPHALTSISGIPANFPANNLTVTYTDFKKIKTLTEGSKNYSLTYGVDDQRRKSVYKENNVTRLTRYYLGDYEEEISPNGNVRKIHYLSGAVLIQNSIGGPDSLLYVYTDYQGSIIALANDNGTVVERYAYDPWGKRRNPDNWEQADSRTSFIINLGYTGHEHLDRFGIINMNGRVYDPLTASFFSPDPFVQAPGNWLNFNRYAYCYGNPFKYVDPSGEIVWFVPVIIGAVIGAYSGGVIANDGQYNPTKWDYSSGKTWGYMLGGAVVGGVSASFGASIAASGGFMANTMGIMGTSFMNSVGTHIYTGGQTPVTMSFGVASYDFTNNNWGYLGKKGNKWYENIGYGLGALANLADVNLLINNTPATLYTDDSDFISHSAIVDDKGNTLMSYGPNDTKVPDSKLGFATYFRQSTSDYTVYPTLPVEVTVNKHIFTLTRGLGKLLPFQGMTTNCVNMASSSLWLNGIPNIGLHPYLLYATTWAYSAGIRPDLFSYYLTNPYKR